MLSANEASYAKMISIFVDMAVEAKKSKKITQSKPSKAKRANGRKVGLVL